MSKLSLAGSAQSASINGMGDPLTDPALIGGQQEGFDAIASGLYPMLTLGDVKYTGVDAPFTVGGDYDGFYNTVGGRSILNDYDMVPSQFRFDFLGTITAFGFNFGASDSNWKLAAFDDLGTLIEEFIINPVLASNAGDYFGISSTSPIAFALLTNLDNDANDFVFIDRFTTNLVKGQNEDVPVPAALPLLASGIAGMAAMRRRKKI
jgi:hypothetical protein